MGNGLVSHEDMSGEPSFRSAEEAEEHESERLAKGKSGRAND